MAAKARSQIGTLMIMHNDMERRSTQSPQRGPTVVPRLGVVMLDFRVENDSNSDHGSIRSTKIKSVLNRSDFGSFYELTFMKFKLFSLASAKKS